MTNKNDTLTPKGELEVWKIFVDGNKEDELVFFESNVITSGMGKSLAFLFSGSGSTDITDYQIRYFQAGSGATARFGASTYEVSANLKAVDYGSNPDVVISEHDQLKHRSKVTTQPFVRIPQTHIYRVGQTSVRFHLVLGPSTANGASLNEFGLFMANPRGESTDESVLVAYRTFSTVQKTTEFSLLGRWSITF